MASDTSLVFNLVARDRASQQLGSLKEKFSSAGTAIGAALGVGVGAAFAGGLDMEATQSKLQAQLGLTATESSRIGKVAGGLYADAYGDSLEQVDEAVGSVVSSIHGMRDASSADLKEATASALNFASTFDVDVSRAVQSVGTLMNSGLAKNSTEAFDLITAASQKVPADLREDVLDASDEYGQFFHSLGYNGEQAFSLLVDASKKGQFGIDKAGDAIKEFTIRSTDMSTSSQAAYKTVGLNARDMANAILKGGDSARGATQKIIDGLLKIKDPSKQANAAIALFGTPLEDLNVKDIPAFLQGLKGSSGSMDDFSGAAKRSGDALNNNAKTALTSFQRHATMAATQAAGSFIQFAMKYQAIFGPLAGLLAGVAVAVLAVSAAQKIYATYTAVASAAQAIWNAEIWATTAALFANPLTWIVIAIIALVAAIVLIATKTNWFQTLWSMVWGKITAYTRTVVGWISSALGWFGKLPGKFASWWGAAKDWAIRKMLSMVAWVTGLPGRARNALAGLAGAVAGRASHAFQSMKNAAVSKATSLISWVRGLPGRALHALGNLGSYLYNSGRSLLRGFVNGIKSMASAPVDAVKGILSSARSYLPFSPAKKGPFSGRGWTLYSGRSTMHAFAQGIRDRAGLARTAMADAVGSTAAGGQQAISTATSRPVQAAPMVSPTAGGVVIVRLETTGAENNFKKFIRGMVRVDGRGSVQTAFS